MFRPYLTAGLLSATLFLGGCSNESKIADHLKKGGEFYAGQKYDRAEIEFLNVLQLDSRSAEAIAQLGAIYFEQGRYGRAMPYIFRAKELNPNNVDNRLRLAALYLSIGNIDEGRGEAEFVLSKRPGDTEAPLLLAETVISPESLAQVAQIFAQVPGEAAARAPMLVARGVLSLREGKVDPAIGLFQQALAADSNFAPAHFSLGMVFAARNEVEKAVSSLQRAADISGPRSPRTVQFALFKLRMADVEGAKKILEEANRKAPDYVPVILRLSEIAISQKQLENAEKLLKGVLALDPNHSEALVMSSRLALIKGDYPRAKAQAESLLKMYPKSPEAHFELARAQAAGGDDNAAIISLNQALVISPEFREAQLLLATVNLRLGNAGVVATSLKGFIQKYPTIFEGYSILGDALRVQRDFNAALALYNEIEKRFPGREQTSLYRGMILKELGKPAEARAAFEQALSRNPNSTAAIDQLVDLDIEAKNFTGAQRRLDAILIARPDVPELHVARARLYMVQGDTAKMEASLRDALKINPDLTQPYMLLARIYIESGQSAKALESLKAVVTRNARDSGAWFMLGSLYEEAKDYDQAKTAYQKSLEAAPQFVPALNNLAHLYSARLGEHDRALELARKAKEHAPTDPNVSDTLGWILYQKGEYSTALVQLRDSASKLRTNAEVNYHLGMAHYMLGDITEAQTALEAAVAAEGSTTFAVDARQRLANLKADVTQGGTAMVAQLEQQLKAGAVDPIISAKLAAHYERAGDLDRAIDLQEKVIQALPGSGPAYFRLARLLDLKGDKKKALELARTGRRLSAESTEGALLLGKLSLGAGDSQQAYNLLAEVARKQPTNADAFRELSLASLATARSQEALSALQTAVRLEKSADDVERLALVEAVDSVERSRTVRQKAEARLSRLPNDTLALLVMARASVDSNAAKASLEKILAQHPDFVPARRDLAVLLVEQGGDDRRALEVGGPVRDQLRQDAVLGKSLGVAAYRTGDFKRASALLDAVKGNFASDALLHFYLGMSQKAAGQAAPARRSLEKAIELGLQSPQLEQAKTAMGGS